MEKKDNKKRKLYTGETQEKDGRYKYRYTDAQGNRKSVYSWKLVETDVLPKGKRDCVPLRELEKEIKANLEHGVKYDRQKMTLYELIDMYLDSSSLKESTIYNYKKINCRLKNYSISMMEIGKIKQFDIKQTLKKISEHVQSRAYYSLMNSAFSFAVENDWLLKNPCSFKLNENAIHKERIPLTPEEEKALLDMLEETGNKRYDFVYILLKTGLRISELAGLTEDDLDFKAHTISVNHQISSIGKRMVTSLKTKSSYRIIPMTDKVEQCFKNIIKNRYSKIMPIMYDETGKQYKNFIFVTYNGNVMYHRLFDKMMNTITEKCRVIIDKNFKTITPHVCRHTFCTRLINAGVPLKNVQYMLGHSSPNVTIGVYTHMNENTLHDDIKKIENF